MRKILFPLLSAILSVSNDVLNSLDDEDEISGLLEKQISN